MPTELVRELFRHGIAPIPCTIVYICILSLDISHRNSAILSFIMKLLVLAVLLSVAIIVSARPRYNPQAHLEQYQYQVNAEDEVKDIDMMLDIAKTQIGDVLDKMKDYIKRK